MTKDLAFKSQYILPRNLASDRCRNQCYSYRSIFMSSVSWKPYVKPTGHISLPLTILWGVLGLLSPTELLCDLEQYKLILTCLTWRPRAVCTSLCPSLCLGRLISEDCVTWCDEKMAILSCWLGIFIAWQPCSWHLDKDLRLAFQPQVLALLFLGHLLK